MLVVLCLFYFLSIIYSKYTQEFRHFNRHPNIIFILTDDQGWNDVSFHNATNVLTPNIDNLAYTGLQLNNYYVTPLCSPTRASLMTGRYDSYLGLQNRVICEGCPFGVPLDNILLPQELLNNGYSTYMVGKWHLGYVNWSYVPTSRGFEHFYGFYGSQQDYYYHNASTGYDWRDDIYPKYEKNKYSTNIITKRVLKILQNEYNIQQQNITNNEAIKPFFLYISYQAQHSPKQAPQWSIDYFNDTINATIDDGLRITTAGQLLVLDKQIGKVINYLKNTKLWDNTLIIYSSDNGGEVFSGGNNYPLRGGKNTLYEGGIKSIGIVNGGFLNDERRGDVSNALIHVTDWYPTICELINIRPTNIDNLDGVSQLTVIQHKNVKTRRREILYNVNPTDCSKWSKINLCGSIRIDKWKLSIGHFVMKPEMGFSGWIGLDNVDLSHSSLQCNNEIPEYTSANTTAPFNGEGVLFDIENDPCETTDRKHENMEIYNMLLSRLKYYNNTQLLPFEQFTDPCSDSKFFNGFLSPWGEKQCVITNTTQQSIQLIQNQNKMENTNTYHWINNIPHMLL